MVDLAWEVDREQSAVSVWVRLRWWGGLQACSATWIWPPGSRGHLCLPGKRLCRNINSSPLLRFDKIVSWELANLRGICVALKYWGLIWGLNWIASSLHLFQRNVAARRVLSALSHPLGCFPPFLRLWVLCCFIVCTWDSFWSRALGSRAHCSVPWVSPLGMFVSVGQEASSSLGLDNFEWNSLLPVPLGWDQCLLVSLTGFPEHLYNMLPAKVRLGLCL